MLSLLRKIIPNPIMQAYHYILARFSSIIYNNPSNKLIVIGITGTNGKSTTVRLIYKILEQAGFKVGATSTIEFKIAEKEWLNNTKMSMIGRFQLQKLLKQMVQDGCQYAVVETTSEGIKQFRHVGINYDIAVFTNLTPEHIESHGSFENYKQAKGQLFSHLSKCKSKDLRKIFNNTKDATSEIQNSNIPETLEKTAIINLDDQHADFFISRGKYKTVGFTLENNPNNLKTDKIINSTSDKNSFEFDNTQINLQICGRYNIYNSLCSATVAKTLNIQTTNIKTALEKIKTIPGRLEFIPNNKNIKIIVDYAPEPESLKQLYKVLDTIEHNQLIHVLGSCGGGRDTARRPILGKMAGQKCNTVIITNEDPYDDDPMEIINQVAQGAEEAGKILDKTLFKILDRQEAIEFAINKAQENNLVLITGKGSEQAMVVANREKIPWDDREAVKKALNKIS